MRVYSASLKHYVNKNNTHTLKIENTNKLCTHKTELISQKKNEANAWMFSLHMRFGRVEPSIQLAKSNSPLDVHIFEKAAISDFSESKMSIVVNRNYVSDVCLHWSQKPRLVVDSKSLHIFGISRRGKNAFAVLPPGWWWLNYFFFGRDWHLFCEIQLKTKDGQMKISETVVQVALSRANSARHFTNRKTPSESSWF